MAAMLRVRLFGQPYVSIRDRFPVWSSIGEIMLVGEVKIDESNGEILVKGKTVTTGYYNRRKRPFVYGRRIFLYRRCRSWKVMCCSLQSASRTL